MTIEIVKYNSSYERGWVHCRVLSFLDTQYFNDVYQKKEVYDSNSIELVAVEKNQVIGLIDIQIENEPQEICSSKDVKSGMLWHIAVHPDHQRKGVGELLLNEAASHLISNGIYRIEAWTKEDDFVRKWYFKNNFEKFSSYYHVRLKGEFIKLKKQIKGLKVLSSFSHYTGSEVDCVKEYAEKIEECIGLEKLLN